MAAKVRMKQEPQQAASRETFRAILPWAALIVLLTAATYLPALNNGFVWDDDAYVTDNQHLQTAHGLWTIWSNPRANVQYYPLVFTTFWIEYHLWGTDTALGYHLVNILLHAAGSILLWRILSKLRVPGALLAALVFAVHPVHVESVAWVTERKNVLSGVFYFSSLLTYLKFLGGQEVGKPEVRRYLLAVLLFAAALLSKTATCALPLTILIVIWWQRGRLTVRDVLLVVPLIAMAVLTGAATVHVESVYTTTEGGGRDWTLDWLGKTLLAGRALWFYFGKLVWPQNLAFVYHRWTVDTAIWWQYLFPAAFAALLAVLLLMRRRIGRGPLAAMLFFAVNLGPALGFIDVYYMRYSWVADHFAYLGSLGPIILISALVTMALGLHRLKPANITPRQAARLVVPAGLLATLSVLSWRQCYGYRDLETLWRTSIATVPDAWMPRNNLGILLTHKGASEEAYEHLTTTLKIKPDYADAHYNLAKLLVRMGRREEAVAEYALAAKYKPEDHEIYNNLGNVLSDLGRLPEAEQQLRMSLSLRADLPETRNNLGAVLQRLGRLDEAVTEYKEAIRLKFDNYAEAHRNLAGALRLQGKVAEAAVHEAAAARLEGGGSEEHVATGDALLLELKPREAVEEYRKALAVAPDSIAALTKLAWIEATHPDPTLRNGADAVKLAEQAAEATDHEHPLILDVLAAAYAEAGRFPEAVATAEKSIAINPDAEAAVPTRERLQLFRAGKPFRASQK